MPQSVAWEGEGCLGQLIGGLLGSLLLRVGINLCEVASDFIKEVVPELLVGVILQKDAGNFLQFGITNEVVGVLASQQACLHGLLGCILSLAGQADGLAVLPRNAFAFLAEIREEIRCGEQPLDGGGLGVVFPGHKMTLLYIELHFNYTTK